MGLTPLVTTEVGGTHSTGMLIYHGLLVNMSEMQEKAVSMVKRFRNL